MFIQTGGEENPTLLHFAARFGLEKLAWQLLECPGAEIACDMKNVNDMTPADLAEQAGHVRLAHQLRGYMVGFNFFFSYLHINKKFILFIHIDLFSFSQQMNEFSNMYSYLKVMSESTNGNANGTKIIPAFLE